MNGAVAELTLLHIRRERNGRKRRHLMRQLGLALMLEKEEVLTRSPHLPGLDYRQFSSDQFYAHFRFTNIDHVDDLVRRLGLPEQFTTPNRLSVSGREALLIVLSRLAFPTRNIILAEMFQRCEGAVSEIFNVTIQTLHERWQHLLAGESCLFSPARLAVAARAVQSKLGLAEPSVVGFIDGTIFSCARPQYGQVRRFGSSRFRAVVVVVSELCVFACAANLIKRGPFLWVMMSFVLLCCYLGGYIQWQRSCARVRVVVSD